MLKRVESHIDGPAKYVITLIYHLSCEYYKESDAIAEVRVKKLAPIINYFFLCFLLSPSVESTSSKLIQDSPCKLEILSIVSKIFLSCCYGDEIKEDFIYNLHEFN